MYSTKSSIRNGHKSRHSEDNCGHEQYESQKVNQFYQGISSLFAFDFAYASLLN